MIQHTATTVEATINILHDHQMLQTTIPTASGWHVKVDNRPVTVKKKFRHFHGHAAKTWATRDYHALRPAIIRVGCCDNGDWPMLNGLLVCR